MLGGVHMVLKNLPWTAEWLARAGYAGHLVRDLSNTHVMIVGGGTLISTGLCWYVLPRIVGRPLSSPGLAQGAFWFTAVGLLVFYVALIANGIAMGRLVSSGWDYEAAKLHMGKAYRVPVGIGAGVMGLGYWCFAANVFLTIFQSRLVRVPKPSGHLWKFLATGAAGLTVGTVQGVIQVQPAHADWLYRAGHAGEWIDPISHAHINLVTGLTMLTAGALFALAPALGGKAPTRRVANLCFWFLLGGSLAFYGVCALPRVPRRAARGASRADARAGRGGDEASSVPDHGSGHRDARRVLVPARDARVRSFRHARGTGASLRARRLRCAGGRHAPGTGPGLPGRQRAARPRRRRRGRDRQPARPAEHARRPDGHPDGRGARARCRARCGRHADPRRRRRRYGGVLRRRHCVLRGRGQPGLERWHLRCGGRGTRAMAGARARAGRARRCVGFGSYARATWRATEGYRAESRSHLRPRPGGVRRSDPEARATTRPIAVAAYEVPMGLLGFPGVGWLFAGYPLAGTVLLLVGPAIAWAAVPLAFTPFSNGPLVQVGWQAELVWLPASTFISTALLFRAHRRRRLRLLGPPPRRRGRRSYRTRVAISVGAIGLLLVTLPFVPAVAGIGGSSVRYTYQTGFTREVTGQFVGTPRGTIKLFAWRDPQETFPADALRLHARDLLALRVRAAAVDAPSAYRLFDLDGNSMPLTVRRSSPAS